MKEILVGLFTIYLFQIFWYIILVIDLTSIYHTIRDYHWIKVKKLPRVKARQLPNILWPIVGYYFAFKYSKLISNYDFK